MSVAAAWWVSCEPFRVRVEQKDRGRGRGKGIGLSGEKEVKNVEWR